MKINKIIKWGTASIGTLGLLGVPLITVACGSTKYARYSFPNQPRVGFWYGYKQNKATFDKIEKFIKYIYDNNELKKWYLDTGLEWPKITNIGLKPYIRYYSMDEIMEDRWINFEIAPIDPINSIKKSPNEVLYNNLDKSTKNWYLPVEITFDTGKTTTLDLNTHSFSYTRSLDLDTLVWNKDTEEAVNASFMNATAPANRYQKPDKNEWAKDEWIFYNEDESPFHSEPIPLLFFKREFTEAYEKDMHDENNKEYYFFNPVNIWYMIMLGETKYWDDFLNIIDYSYYTENDRCLPLNWRELVQS